MFSQSNIVKLDECLACGSTNLVPTLDLGHQPLANSYKSAQDEVQDEFPLAVNRCIDCYHVQLTHAVNPELMYKEYLYVSGTSHTMREHFKWFAEYAYETHKAVTGRQPFTVFDIGCNDGSQLDAFLNLKDLLLKTYGIDPAENLYPISSTKGHTVWSKFFDMDFVLKNNTYYDVVVAQNVFAHSYNPVMFLQTVRNVLDDDGLLFIQTSQADMILNGEFDTIYHEHISFYNINSMNELCNRMSLYLVDVAKCPLHGNSYIFVISKNPIRGRPSNIQNLIAMERKAGLYTEKTYVDYATGAAKVNAFLHEATRGCGNEGGFHLIGYGAAAKGMTLLNYTMITPEFIVDDNPLKQGKFTPGGGIPIVSIDKLNDIEGPIVFLPLAWNFFDEIRDRIKLRRDNQYDLFIKFFPVNEMKVTK